MCLIIEHAKLKRNYATLQVRNKELESLIPIPIIPVTDLVMISREDYLDKMWEQGIQSLIEKDPCDWEFSLTSKAELDRIAPELVFAADDYVNNIKDCEDFALQAQSKAADYHVSGIRAVFGDMPLGYHSWLVTMDKDFFKIWWLETMACHEYPGVWCQIGEHGYKPKRVFA